MVTKYVSQSYWNLWTTYITYLIGLYRPVMTLKWKSDFILSSYGLKYFVENFTCWDFLKWPKKGNFGSITAFYSIRAVTTLTVVVRGLPRLRTTKRSWFKNLGHTRYMADSYCSLVPALWECMSDDSWYSGPALRVGIRSTSLTV